MLEDSRLVFPSNPMEGKVPKRFERRLNRVWFELMCHHSKKRFVRLNTLSMLTLNAPAPQLLEYNGGFFRKHTKSVFERFISDLVDNLPYSCNITR